MVTADVLTAHGYVVVQTTSPQGCIAKLDYEKPDVLLVDTAMPRLAFDDLLGTALDDTEHADLIVVAFSSSNPRDLEKVCLEKNLHGYFHKEMDVTRLPEYMDNFF